MFLSKECLNMTVHKSQRSIYYYAGKKAYTFLVILSNPWLIVCFPTRFFQNIGDYSSAVRFLVISGCLGDAFRLSREHGQLELYAEILAQECAEGEASSEFHSLALHAESQGKHLLAGKYYYHAGDHRKVSTTLYSTPFVLFL